MSDEKEINPLVTEFISDIQRLERELIQDINEVLILELSDNLKLRVIENKICVFKEISGNYTP